MKSCALLKISMPLLGLAAVLVVAPQARAQSDVSPDHFDGTDSWAVALAAKEKPAKSKTAQAVNAKQVNAKPQVKSIELRQPADTKPGSNAAQVQETKLVAADKRRSSSTPKTKNQ